MFLYPALTIGFLFVAVPLLVHLINMLRHRRQRWAAMDFLLASYRKQKKWIVLRQMLLLLTRLALAALLIALLAGWSGGRKFFNVLGGQTTHHVVVLDDSYSMGDDSGGAAAYQTALQTLSDLTRRLSLEDGEHQLTVLRASRSALAIRGGDDSGDTAADLSAQTITADARVINRVMATAASPLRTDVTPALELAGKLIDASDADEQYLYVISDFRARDWGQPDRIAELLQSVEGDAKVRLVDCALGPGPNLAITDLSPRPDVWVAGVPVVVNMKVKNFSATVASNVTVAVRLVLYGDDVTTPDPAATQSGTIDAIPALVIESIQPGEEVTKSFQVFVGKPGTHVIEANLPEDALAADNRRICTLPLSDTERVLVIDDDADGRGAYHVQSVLNPGSQVRIGAVPERQPVSFLRSITADDLSVYRAVYLIDVPMIGEETAAALDQYVRRGGGVAWFLGDSVDRTVYNQTLSSGGRYLLPAKLDQVVPLESADDGPGVDVMMGDDPELMQPLAAAGDGVFSLIGLSKSWTFESFGDDAAAAGGESSESASEPRPRVRVALKRGDGLPLVTRHDYGAGRIITVAAGLDGGWTNWQGDPTFVVFLLQANASLWSAASPSTSRFVDESIVRAMPSEQYADEVTWLPATGEAPRLPIEIRSDAFIVDDQDADGATASRTLRMDPAEAMADGELNLDDLINPGLGELVFTELDGRTTITPVATNIRVGENDLARAAHVEILRDLPGIRAEFVDVGQWNEQANRAGSSMISLFLLALLAALFALEQFLASWASYHTSGKSLTDTGKAAHRQSAAHVRGTAGNQAVGEHS